jgi:hypothetical protein
MFRLPVSSKHCAYLIGLVIICITSIEGFALHKGIDGKLLSTYMGFMGFTIGMVATRVGKKE